ncbi:MAG: cysteine protease [Pleopsidium flavum]|nr:MAG: cysteine protease [Pleopsidium flavum]
MHQDEALKAAIEATEHCMHALKAATNEDQKTQLDKKCRALLEQAERIKLSICWETLGTDLGHAASGQTSSSESGSKLEEPLSSRQLSTREQIILLEGSKLNGFVFPQWKSSPDPNEFESRDGEQRFLDTAELHLSSMQRDVFDGWKRPEEVLSPPGSRVPNEDIKAGPTMISHGNVDLVQDITTDCSVVASLCAGTARAERGHAKVEFKGCDRVNSSSC